MPRYFFHVHDGQDMPDDDGITLAGVEDARAQAVVAVAEALWDLGAKFWEHPDWRMNVVDEHGARICELRLSNHVGAE